MHALPLSWSFINGIGIHNGHILPLKHSSASDTVICCVKAKPSLLLAVVLFTVFIFALLSWNSISVQGKKLKFVIFKGNLY